MANSNEKAARAAADRIIAGSSARFTPPRRRALEVLLAARAAMKAYDVVTAMGKDVKPMTAYRALDFLVSEGLAHRIESLNAYVACAAKHCVHRDSQYLICDSCGGIQELHDHAINDFIREQLASGGFALTRSSMELHGVCGECKS